MTTKVPAAPALPSNPDHRTPADRVAAVVRIAAEVAGPAANEVDRDARFPQEAIEALKRARMLSAYVPANLGGYGASVRELSLMCEALGRRCSASAMVFAMHQIQVACIARHGGRSGFFRDYLGEVVAQQRLIASVTSEAGVGGSTRTSISPIERTAGTCTLRKEGTVVSYGEQADDLLITVRRSPEAAASDQALVLARKSQSTMTKLNDWDTFGMRGTCSPGYVITAKFAEEQIVPAPFADISSWTMVPFAHILWGACWLGIATDAVERASAFVRNLARQTPGVVPPAAVRLSETATWLQVMRAQVRDAATRYDSLLARPDGGAEQLASVRFAIEINHLKLAASQLVVDIVTRALRVIGTAGYRNDSPFSVTRHMRDAHSAALMIANDRINAGTAALYLVHKGEGDGLDELVHERPRIAPADLDSKPV
jgi:acyl-CoA dehydrogenase